MTRDSDQLDKVRAVFLAALMVVSVFGGTIAFAGGAAAATISLDLSDELVQGGEEIQVNGSVNQNGTVYVFIDEDNSGNYTSGDTYTKVYIENYSKDNSFSVSLNAPSDTGSYDVHAYQEENDDGTSSITEGKEGDQVTSLEVDATKPLFGAGEDRKVTTSTPTLTVPLSDENTSINASTIEVDVKSNADGTGDSVVHMVNAPSSDSDGISYDSSAGEITIDFSAADLSALEDGTYDVTITAEDEVGNSNSTNFDLSVDTESPAFDLTTPTEGTTVSSSTQDVTVALSGNINYSTAEIEITDADGNVVVSNMSTDEADDAGLTYTNNTDSPDTFTVSPGDGSVPELDTGTYTVSISAADEFGNSASDSFSFSVDVTQPHVDSVTTDQDLYTEDDSVAVIAIDASEAVNASTMTAEVSIDGTTTALSDFEQGDDGDDSVVYTTVDLKNNYDGIENGSAQVVATGGEDVVGNSLNTTAGSNSTTFAIDTIEPKPSIDSNLPDPLRGLVDIEQYVSVTDADGNGVEIGWAEHGGEITWFDNPSSVDTRDLSEGTVHIVAQATDDNGTTSTTVAHVTVDNAEPSVAYTGDEPLPGTESGTTYEVKDLVSVSDNGTNDVAQYGYYKLGTDETASDVSYSDITWSSEVTIDADARYVFAAELEDDLDKTFLKTGAVDANVFEASDVEVSLSQNNNDAGKLNVTVTSVSQLDALNVTVQSVDNYYGEQVEQTVSLSDFEETETDSGYEYTLVWDAPRDGVYQASFDNAAAGGLTLDSADIDSDSVLADGSAPSIVDADIVGMADDGDDTVVEVRFSEPLSTGDIDAMSFADDRTSIVSVSGDWSEGKIRLVFEGQLQTGDDNALLTAEEGALEDYSGNDNAEQSIYVDSAEIDLHEGLNYVSVPIKGGEISLDSLDLSGVDAVWAYDDGEWVSYDPAAEENELTALEGGMGYVVVANSSTSFDVRGYTAVAESAGDGPTAPQVQELEPGWNLIGHYQTGEQKADVAVGELSYDSSVGILGENGEAVSLQYVDQFQPGEGYWVFVRQSGLYTPVKDSGGIAGPTINSLSVTDGGDDIVTNDDQITVTADVSAEAGVDVVWANVSEVNTSQSELVPLTHEGDGVYSTTVDVSGVSDDDELTVDVWARDTYGQFDYANGSVTTDTSVDTVSISGADATNVDFTVNDENGIASANLKVIGSDGTADINKTYSSNTSTAVSTDTLAADNYTVKLTATDTLGNTKTVTTQFDVVDSTTPSLMDASATPNQTTWDAQSDTDTTFTFNVSGLSADGNTDEFWLKFPDELDGQISASSVTVEGSSDSSDKTLVDLDDDGSADALKFIASQDGGGTYTADVTVQMAINYTADGDYPVALNVSDSDGDKLSDTTLVTLTADNSAPTYASLSSNATDANGNTTLDVVLNDSLSGINKSSIDASDFNVTNTSSGNDVLHAIDTSNVNDGATGNQTVVLILDGDYTGTQIQVAIEGEITDEVGNGLTTGSETVTP